MTLDDFQEAGRLAATLKLFGHTGIGVHVVDEAGNGQHIDHKLAIHMIQHARSYIHARLREFGLEEPT